MSKASSSPVSHEQERRSGAKSKGKIKGKGNGKSKIRVKVKGCDARPGASGEGLRSLGELARVHRVAGSLLSGSAL